MSDPAGPLRVAFDARVLEHPELAERGIGRYAGSLLAALQQAGRDLIALRDLRRPPAPKRIAEVFEHASLARDVRRARAQVLHSPSIDFATTRPGAAYVMTIHDLVPLKQPERYLSTGIKHRLRYAAARRATQVIVPTRTVASDCERLLAIDTAGINVIAEAAAPVFRPVADPAPLLAHFALPEQFVLWVGGLDPPDPRKRVRELATVAARRHGLPLVLAGRVSPDSAGLAARGQVLLIGRPSDEELAALYTAATALVVASEDEGFGLPPMEALACETPVAAFGIDSMREQYAGSRDVTLVEPGDYIGLLDAAEAFAGRRAAAPARSWADVAAETWAVYKRAARLGA